MRYVIEYESDYPEDAEYVRRRLYDAINEANIRRGMELKPERPYDMVIEEHVGRFLDTGDESQFHAHLNATGDCAHLDVVIEFDGTLRCCACYEKVQAEVAQEA